MLFRSRRSGRAGLGLAKNRILAVVGPGQSGLVGIFRARAKIIVFLVGPGRARAWILPVGLFQARPGPKFSRSNYKLSYILLFGGIIYSFFLFR